MTTTRRRGTVNKTTHITDFTHGHRWTINTTMISFRSYLDDLRLAADLWIRIVPQHARDLNLRLELRHMHTDLEGAQQLHVLEQVRHGGGGDHQQSRLGIGRRTFEQHEQRLQHAIVEATANRCVFDKALEVVEEEQSEGRTISVCKQFHDARAFAAVCIP